jgi:hypothetical protein
MRRRSPEARTDLFTGELFPEFVSISESMMKKLSVLSAAALISIGSMAAPTNADARHWRGGAVAAGLISGIAAGALIGAAASSAYAAPAYYPAYGYAPVSYWGYPPPPVYRTRVVRRVYVPAPAYRTRVVHVRRPAYRTRVVRRVYARAPVYRTRVVRTYHAPAPYYAPAAYGWSGPSVSVGFGFGAPAGFWW